MINLPGWMANYKFTVLYGTAVRWDMIPDDEGHSV